MGFPFQNNPKNLDPSFEMDLDFGVVLEKKKNNILQKKNKYSKALCEYCR